MRFARPAIALAALSAPLFLASCADPAPLYVDQAWVRMNPNGQGPAAGYFVIHGGEEPARLLRVTSEGAVRIEMHETVMKDGMMSMRPVDGVDVPAGKEVKFAPGGKHLMIFSLNPAVAQTGKMTMTMVFSNGDRLIVDAAIRQGGAGDSNGKMAMPGNAHDAH